MPSTDWLSAEFRARIKADKFTYGYPFVTISREAGAGGHSLAQAIQAETGSRQYADLYRDWIVLDEEICTAVMNDPDLHVSMKELVTEEYDGPLRDLIHEVVGKRTSHYTINKRIFEFIKLAARYGKVVLVGRGGSCATRGLAGGIHIRLVAPKDIREVHMANRFGVELDQARRMVRKQDSDRARMLRDFFNRDIEDPALYDAVYDTEEIPIDQIAREVIVMIEDRARAVSRA